MIRRLCLLLLHCSCVGGDLPCCLFGVCSWPGVGEKMPRNMGLNLHACSSATYFLVQLTQDPCSPTISLGISVFFSSPPLSTHVDSICACRIHPLTTVLIASPIEIFRSFSTRYTYGNPFVHRFFGFQESNHEVHLTRRLPRPFDPLRRRGCCRHLRASAGRWCRIDPGREDQCR